MALVVLGNRTCYLMFDRRVRLAFKHDEHSSYSANYLVAHSLDISFDSRELSFYSSR